jgi:hypothetical protein
MAVSYAIKASGSGLFNPVAVPGGWFEFDVIVQSAGGDYPTGGYAFGIAQIQTLSGGAYSALEAVSVAQHWQTLAGGGTTAFLAAWNSTTNKVQAYGMVTSGVTGSAFAEATANDAGLAAGMGCILRVKVY